MAETWREILAHVRNSGHYFGEPSNGQTTGGTHARTSYHYKGTALDGGWSDSNMEGCFNYLEQFANYPGCPLAELFLGDRQWKNGSRIHSTSIASSHRNHWHAALAVGRRLPPVGEVGGHDLGSRLLRKGDRGADVAEWQRILNVSDDGVFGPQTEEATKAVQRSKGLADDGIVGPKTLEAARAPAPPAPQPLPPAPNPGPFHIVTKAEWGAEPSKGALSPLKIPVAELWVHHTVTTPTDNPHEDAKTVQRVAFQRGFNDTSYCYLIHPNGTVLEGRGITVGAHTKDRNSISIGVAFIGNLSVLEPTPEAMESGRRLRQHLIDTGALAANHSLRGHRDNPASPSECPGNNLYARLPELGGKPAPAPAPVPTQRPPAPPAPAPDWTEEVIMALPLVRRGDKGQHVRNVQGLLVANGEGVSVDGDFGPGTERGLSNWQGRAGIGADGICGPTTWRRLLSA